MVIATITLIKPHTLAKNEGKEMCENGNKVQQGI